MTLTELSLFYKNLAELYSAGISFNSMFSTLQVNEKNLIRKNQLKYIGSQVAAGKSLSDSLKRTGFVPVSDYAIIKAGEKSGTLNLIFENLASHYVQSAQAEKTIRSGMIKPFFILAAALFVPSFPDLFTEKITLTRYLTQSFGVLGVFAGLAFFIHYTYMRSLYDLQMARTRHGVFKMIPVLHGLTKKMVLEKFISGLAMMLNSGLAITDALAEAGQCSADSEIAEASVRIRNRIQAGGSLPQSFQIENVFPAEIQNNILLGNESGKIPDFLKRSANTLKTEIRDTVEKISRALPVIIYWAVTIYVGWTIVGFQRARLKELDSVLLNI